MKPYVVVLFILFSVQCMSQSVPGKERPGSLPGPHRNDYLNYHQISLKTHDLIAR
ncbi:hypothetical protein FHK02_4081 [Spirosoma sp. LMG 31448]|uniref:Uncharacterized protein n=1 Tax=Spirosoma utsteinense TaxID=2585773 RepID=A0ABR6W6P8_9BACT|nr:hypothetical protein [Spirosoma utsteinense]MBC3792240.1 hypothetical protein [Spirosoma utsteinense]